MHPAFKKKFKIDDVHINSGKKPPASFTKILIKEALSQMLKRQCSCKEWDKKQILTEKDVCLKRNLTLTLNYQQLISNKENQAALNVLVLLEVNSHSTYKHSRVYSLKDCNRQQMTKLSLSVQHRSENSHPRFWESIQADSF